MFFFAEHIRSTDDHRTGAWIAILFGVVALAVSVILTAPGTNLQGWVGLSVFMVASAVSMMLAGQKRQGIYLTLGTASSVAAYLAFGPGVVVVMAYGSIALEELLRSVFYRQVSIERHTLWQSLISVMLIGGTTVCAILSGGALYHNLGGILPLITLEITDLPPLLACFALIFICMVIPFACAYRAVYPAVSRRRALVLLGTFSITEFFLLPLGALFAILYFRLSIFNFIGCLVILLMGIALTRFTELNRDQLEHRVRELAVFNAFAQAISTHLSMDDLLDTLDREISQIVPNDFFLISLRDPVGAEWSFPLVRQGTRRLVWDAIPSPTALGDYLMKTRQPLLIQEDVAKHLEALNIRDLKPPIPHSMITVPLIAGNQVIGVMSIESFQPDRVYTRAETDQLSTVAPQIAAALNNAQLYSRTQLMAQELSKLNEVSRVISATLDVDQVLETIGEALQQVMRTPIVGVILVPNDEWNDAPEPTGYLAHLPQALQMIIRSGFTLERARSDSVTPPQNYIYSAAHASPTNEFEVALQTVCEASQITSIVFAELRLQKRLIGQIVLGYEQPHELSTIEERMLNTLANQATVAVSNAVLYNEAQGRANEMKELVESSHALIESFEINFVGSTTVNRLHTALLLDEVGLLLWNFEEDQFEPIVSFMNRLPDYALMQDTLLAEVVTSQKALRLPRNAEDEALLATFGLQVALVLPIVLRSDAVGVAFLGRKEYRHLSRRDQQFAEALLHQTATALDNARLFNLIDAELEERIQQLSAIESVSRKLSATLDRKTMIQEILSIVLSVINADIASFGLENAPGLLHFETRAQLAPGASNELTIWQGLTGRVMRTGRFALTGDVSADADYVPVVPGMRSEIVVPIMLNGHPIGVLDLESSRANAFNTSHLSFLTTLAEHAAIAINKAQLFADIQRRNEEMRAILDSTHDGMVLLSPKGELLQANPAAERILTLELRKLMGHNLITALARNARKTEADQRVRYPWTQLRDALRTLRVTPDIVTRFTYHITVGESLRQIEETGVPVNDDEGNLTARLFVLRDVTEIMELERFKEHLTDTVVHDLRSPLGSVITSLYLIDEATRDEDFTTIRKVTPAALTLANDLLSMVTSILEVRKMQSGALDLQKTPTDLQVPVERAIQTVAFVAQQFDITILNLIPADLPALDIDVEKIRRVLVNLLDNALKFTPDQGQVRVEATFQPARHMVTISVTDTGRGIPEEYRDRVFELFTTVPKELSTGRRRGTGIGLTFCRLTIEAHGGRIWVESGPEGGTAMRFTLPVADDPPDEAITQQGEMRTAAASST